MTHLPHNGTTPAGPAGSQWPNRYPNIFYHTIAVICVILVVVEVAGYLKGDGVKIAILVGLAILALLAPNIESLKIGKSGIVAALKRGIDENSSKIDDTKSAAREIDVQLDQKITQIFEELRELRTSAGPIAAAVDGGANGGAAQRDEALKLPAITDEKDPQKGRFGRQEQRNGRKISALVEVSSIQSGWGKVSLKVTSLPGSPELAGKVDFYLHDTFRPDHYVVQVINGEATLVLRAWGAFTVGAVADAGATPLELDLATSPNVVAPEDWRTR
jgi:prokaryotic YEATS domain